MWLMHAPGPIADSPITRFTVGGHFLLSVFNLVNVRKAAPGPIAGSLLTTRFTVGHYFRT